MKNYTVVRQKLGHFVVPTFSINVRVFGVFFGRCPNVWRKNVSEFLAHHCIERLLSKMINFRPDPKKPENSSKMTREVGQD